MATAESTETKPRKRQPPQRTRIEQVTKRAGQLKQARAVWMPRYQSVTDRLLPWSGRQFIEDRNRPKDVSEILDNWGTLAHRTMQSGLMAGASSPARPWLRMATSDPELNEYHPVKVFLDNLTKLILRSFADSNTYRMLHQVYGELGGFGTAASIALPDDEALFHHEPLTAGDYCLAQNFRKRVDTLYREFEMTVIQVVEEFGLDNCSKRVENAYDQGDYENPVAIMHMIEPRRNREYGKEDAGNKPFSSCYYEKAGDDRGQKVLRDSGFDTFPVLAPRWDLRPNDLYGFSPAMMALGDIKQLQHEQYRKGLCIDLQTDPPVQTPTSLAGQDVEMTPGGRTAVDAVTAQAGIRAITEYRLDMNALLMDIQDVRQRIDRAFFADLFLMLHNAPVDSRRTATEIAERHEEKLIMLGPVLERLEDELFSPLVELAFVRLRDRGQLPPIPPELYGATVKPKFTSILAQAQAAIGTNSVDRFVGGISVVKDLNPDVIDNFNVDVWAQRYSSMLGVDPDFMVPPDQVKALREARAKALAAKAQMEAMEQQSKTARNLAASPTGGESNALGDVMNAFSVGLGAPAQAG